MKIGLFGGAFDPIHNGHMSMISGALKWGVDIVIVIPSARNAFKQGSILSAAPYRFYMTDIALRSISNKKVANKVLISDIEFQLLGISYTVKTCEKIISTEYLNEFLKQNGFKDEQINQHHDFFWICGSDILESFDKWYEPGILLSMVNLLVAVRPGDDTDINGNISHIEKRYNVKLQSFEIKGKLASSSDIRKNKDYSLLPSEVKRFITKNALYDDINPIDYLTGETLELFYELAIKLFFVLSKDRLIHTLNVAMYAGKLAIIHKVNVDKVMIAGILHDCAKEYDEDMQRDYARKYAGNLFENKKLLHSPAGAYLALNEYNVQDKEILDAINYHTTGRANMTLIDKLVYIADKIEPAREYSDLKEMRKMALIDIDKTLNMVAMGVKAKFVSQKRDIHPLTQGMLESLKWN